MTRTLLSLLTGLLAMFALGTAAWIACAILLTGGDFMNFRAGFLVVPAIALAAGFLGARTRHAAWRGVIGVASVGAAAFWIFMPDGWWASPPPPPSIPVPAAVAPVAPAPPACDAVKAWRSRVIQGNADDAEAVQVLARCLASGELVGRTREDLEAALGPSGPATVFSSSFGYTAQDRTWPVGTLPEGWVGGVPNLVVTFGSDGRSERAGMVHTQ